MSMRSLIFLTSILIFYFVYGFYISQFDVQIVPLKLNKVNSDSFYDYKGVLNVHSKNSLGSGSINQILSSAKSVGLDFIILTDLNEFDIPYASEGYDGSTLILTGAKYGYLDSRLIYYTMDKKSVGANLGEAQVTLSDFMSQKKNQNKNHVLFLSDPNNTGAPWTGEIPPGLDGVEVINLKNLSLRAWQSSKLSVFWSLLFYPFNPTLSLVRLFSEPTEGLSLLDQVSQDHHFLMYAGAEASARAEPISGFYLKFPSYQKNFEIFTTHLLLKSELTGLLESDRQKIFAALKSGQFYLGFDLLGETKGFTAYLEDGNKTLPLGSTVKINKKMALISRIPTAPSDFFELVVYRNGLRYLTINSNELNMPITEPGTYRIQVRVSPFFPLPDGKKWVTWIYTNPIFIE